MRGGRSRGSRGGGETAVGRAGGEGPQRAEQKGGSKGKEEHEARGEHEVGNRATRQDPRPRSLPAPPLLPEPAPGSWGPRPARTLQAERSAVWKCCSASLKEMRGTGPDFPGSPAGRHGAASALPAQPCPKISAGAGSCPTPPPQALLGSAVPGWISSSASHSSRALCASSLLSAEGSRRWR